MFTVLLLYVTHSKNITHGQGRACADIGEVGGGGAIHRELWVLHDVVPLKHALVDPTVLECELALQID